MVLRSSLDFKVRSTSRPLILGRFQSKRMSSGSRAEACLPRKNKQSRASSPSFAKQRSQSTFEVFSRNAFSTRYAVGSVVFNYYNADTFLRHTLPAFARLSEPRVVRAALNSSKTPLRKVVVILGH